MAGYGEMLFKGTGTSYSSMDQARIWWSKAADAGNGRALNGMGRLYFYGSGGLAQSTEQAIVSFEKAVEAGESAGRTNIATILNHDPSARKFLKNGNILQARSDSVAGATGQAAQAEAAPGSSGSGFFGAMLGGAISTIVDRNAAVMNSAIASSGGVAAGALTSANTALARETKEQIAQGMGGNGSMEGMAGMAVGSAIASGSTAGAVAAFSGAATSNLAAAGGGNSTSGNSGGDNWSGVRNEISGLMHQSRTAGKSTAQSLAGASAVVGSCSTAASGGFADQLQGRFNKYKNDGQCGPIVQSAEAIRVRAIANCKAGDTKSADIIYGTQYLRQMVPYVKSVCP